MGLDDFDEDEAAYNLGAIGDSRPDLMAMADQADQIYGPPAPEPVPVEAPPPPDLAPVEAPAVPDVQAPTIEAPTADPLPVQAAPAPADLPDAAGGKSPGTAAGPGAFQAAQPPPPPAFTGDPTKDTQANLEWQRALQAHHDKERAGILQVAHGANAKKAADEVALARESATKQQALREKAKADREAASKQISDAVNGRAAAQKDLEGANWADKHTGRKLVAIIAGGFAQGLMNTALIQSGHAPNAQNEGANAIDKMIADDYAKRKARLAGASDSLLAARQGYQDGETARRAAQNDLDAEFAAKWKLVAAEAEHRARMMGASDEDIKANALIADARQKSAAHEGEILNRESQRQEQREHNKATEAMAQAHLNLAAQTAAGTRADRASAREDRRDAAEDRKGAREEKRDDKLGARTLRDPDTQEPLGLAPVGANVDKLSEGIAASRAYQRKINALADHIEKYGHILNPLSEQGKIRSSLSADSQAQGRQVSGLQASDAGQQLEHSLIGGSGVGFERTADPKRLRELAREATHRLEEHLRSTLAPMPGAAKAAVPTAPKEDAAAPKATEKAPEKAESPKGGKPAWASDKATVDKLRGVADDPKAPAAAKLKAENLLRSAGLSP